MMKEVKLLIKIKNVFSFGPIVGNLRKSMILLHEYPSNPTHKGLDRYASLYMRQVNQESKIIVPFGYQLLYITNLMPSIIPPAGVFFL